MSLSAHPAKHAYGGFKGTYTFLSLFFHLLLSGDLAVTFLLLSCDLAATFLLLSFDLLLSCNLAATLLRTKLSLRGPCVGLHFS